jgi:uncharacterized membrane protein YfcA
LSSHEFLSLLSHSAGIQSWRIVALLLSAAFIAGLARGFSGFGAALIFVPLASAIVGPRLAGPILLVIDIVASLGLLPNAYAQADRRDVSVMSMGAVFAVPLGAAALIYADPFAMRWAISVTAIGFLLLLLSGWRFRAAPTTPLTVGVGVVAGFFSGAAQLGGPPVVTYWLGGQNRAARVRANIVLYFAISSVFSTISYWWAGLFGVDVFALAVVTGPIYAIGLFFGAKCFGLAREETFRWISFGLIGLAAVISLPLLDGWIR